MSAGIPELVQKLVGSGKKVFLVSGGFRVIINPVATMLGIPLEHVFANSILHKVRCCPKVPMGGVLVDAHGRGGGGGA